MSIPLLYKAKMFRKDRIFRQTMVRGIVLVTGLIMAFVGTIALAEDHDPSIPGHGFNYELGSKSNVDDEQPIGSDEIGSDESTLDTVNEGVWDGGSY